MMFTSGQRRHAAPSVNDNIPSKSGFRRSARLLLSHPSLRVALDRLMKEFIVSEGMPA
jgi:hypothetical protein